MCGRNEEECTEEQIVIINPSIAPESVSTINSNQAVNGLAVSHHTNAP